MPSITYTRHDHVVRIESDGKAATILSTPPNGLTVRTPIATEVLDRAANGNDADLRKALAAAGALSTPTKIEQPSTIHRALIEVSQRRWAAISFYSFLFPSHCLVPSSPVLPR